MPLNDEQKENLQQIGGAASLVGAGLIGDKINREGLLDGRKKLYHNTNKKNINSILEKGLLASRANDPNAYTNVVMSINGVEDMEPFKNKTYLATKRSFADGVGIGRSKVELMKDSPFGGLIPPSEAKIRSHASKNQKTIKASVPIDEFKNFKIVRNPELQGLSPYQYAKKLYDRRLIKDPAMLISDTIGARGLLKDTIVIDGDFAAKNFKKSKHYIKNSPKQIAKYIAKHPGRAGIGALGTGVATGLAAGGTKMLYDSTLKRKKEANIYLDAIEKVAELL